MPNQVGPAPPFRQLSADLPLRMPARVPGLERRDQWRVQRKATARFTIPCRFPAPTCSTSQAERKSLTRQHHHLHRVGVTPTRSKPASFLCQAQRQAGKTASISRKSPGRPEHGKSRFSQRGGNGEGGSQRDVEDKGHQRRKGHLPTPA